MFRPCNVNLKLIGSVEKREGFFFFLFSALFVLDEDLLREFIIANLSFNVRKWADFFCELFALICENLPYRVLGTITRPQKCAPDCVSFSDNGMDQTFCCFSFPVLLYLFSITSPSNGYRPPGLLRVASVTRHWFVSKKIKLCYFGHWKSLYNFVLYCFIWSIYSY